MKCSKKNSSVKREETCPLSNMDHTTPAGWGRSRWLPCLDWQAGGFPDADLKSRKILYQMQQILVSSKAKCFLFEASFFIRYRLCLQSFKENIFKFKGNIFRFKGLSPKYHTVMKTKLLQDKSWIHKGDLKAEQVDRVNPFTWYRKTPFRY